MSTRSRVRSSLSLILIACLASSAAACATADENVDGVPVEDSGSDSTSFHDAAPQDTFAGDDTAEEEDTSAPADTATATDTQVATDAATVDSAPSPDAVNPILDAVVVDSAERDLGILDAPGDDVLTADDAALAVDSAPTLTDSAATDSAATDSAVASDAAPTDAGAPLGILVMRDTEYTTHATPAVTFIGRTPIVSTNTDFVAKFNAGGFNAIIVDTPYQLWGTGVEGKLDTWVKGGGRLVLTYWQLEGALTLTATLKLTAFQVESTRDVYRDTAATVNVFAGVRGVPSPLYYFYPEAYRWHGVELTPVGSGAPTVVARFGSSSTAKGAIVVSADGHVIVNGFSPPDFANRDRDGDGPDVQELFVNELSYVLSK